jgi:hypothetical protein
MQHPIAVTACCAQGSLAAAGPTTREVGQARALDLRGDANLPTHDVVRSHDDREAAWDAVHEALPACWRLGPPSFDPGRGAWSVSAVGPHPGRGRIPQSVSGFGSDEVSALRALDGHLRGVAQPDGGAVDALRRRLRFANVEGAEEWSRQHVGRPLTTIAHARPSSRDLQEEAPGGWCARHQIRSLPRQADPLNQPRDLRVRDRLKGYSLDDEASPSSRCQVLKTEQYRRQKRATTEAQ